MLAWISVRRLLPDGVASIVLFGLAALLTERDLHLAAASLAFAATVAPLRPGLPRRGGSGPATRATT